MKCKRLGGHAVRLIQIFASGDAAGKIREVYPEVRVAVFGEIVDR
jgi:hypothetical protein